MIVSKDDNIKDLTIDRELVICKERFIINIHNVHEKELFPLVTYFILLATFID